MTDQISTDIETQTALRNPFPGLRPFSIEESHLFFGREGQSEIVLDYLSKNRFAAVTGASGSGKSSLIYCGIIPTLYGGFITEAGSYWKIVKTRPGNSPVESMAEALVKAEIESTDEHLLELYKQINYTILRRSSYGLKDVIDQMDRPQNENILLILDQFEELFRFKDSRKDTTAINETEAYIKLIVNIVNQRDLPVYVILTMRSDFMGECSHFHELTKLINQSNFLIPQMTRQDFREAILGPIAVGEAEIETQLVQHILNSIGDRSDQLPVLQHAMMRTWEFWIKYNEPGAALRLRDYEAAGRLENALSKHANEAYDELDDEGKNICKSVFKILTEKGADNKGIRHPATIRQIGEVAKVADEKVIIVVEKFRAKGRSFLTPDENTPLDADTVIDISHESLMRVWDKLINWVDEEASSVQMYMRLAEAASMYQIGKSGLWSPPDLHLALNWRKTQQPTLAWAKKYNPAFEKVMVFLDASEKKYLQEEKNKIKLQREQINRTRKLAMFMGVVALVVFGLSGFLYFKLNENKKLREQIEQYALILEGEKDQAVEESEKEKYRRLEAELQAAREQDQKKIALMLSKQAEIEKQLALEEANKAQQRSEELTVQTEISQREKELAEQRAQQSLQEKTEAEKEKEQEYRRRMLSIAQTLANKSLQISNPDLKALLAYQAYLFNEQYQGQLNHPDIYSALYASTVAFKGNDFNALKGHEGAVRSLTFIPRSSIFYSAGGDGKVLRWDLMNKSHSYQTLIKNNFINRSLNISDNGRWLACGTGNASIQLFNLNKPGTGPKVLEGHNGWVWALDFTPDNNGLISTSTDKSIIYWDLISNSNRKITTYDSRIRSISIAPNGKYVTGGTDNGKVIVWDISTGDAETIYEAAGNTIYVVNYNKRGNIIAFGDKNGYLRLINANTKKVYKTIKAHGARILDINFSPDSRQIATSSMDGTIKVWNTSNLSIRPLVITEHESWVISIAFSPDGKKLVSSSNDKDMILIFPTYSSYMADELCRNISRNLTKQEWETYVGYDIDYEKTCRDK